MPLIPIKGKLNNKPDQELLSIFIKGKNMDVLGELFGRYMHLVYGVCLKYLNNRDDAKDAVMQIFEKINTDVFRFEIGNFKSWLFVVTKNFCLMELRKNKRKFKINNEENSANIMEKDAEVHPIDKEQEINLEKALLECIEKLKGEQQKCIRLFYFEDKCYREIASEIEIDEKKVKSNIQNGKRNLKICLENNHG